MSKKRTTDRLLNNYNTISRRPTIEDDQIKEMIFKSFQRTLGSLLPGNPSARILDIACGEGAFLSFLSSKGYRNLSGFDLSPENIAICQRLGLEFVKKFDALEIESFSSEEYDVIFALDIVEHLPKEELSQFLEQVRRKLTSNGYVIIQTPNMGSLLATYMRYNDLSHEHGLTEKTAIDLLLTAGFERKNISVYPAWNATTRMGYLREAYLRLIHNLIFLVDGESRPRISSRNLIIVAKI
jgi:2-polyprenyl-3-methyl-5-hydroxy-6-metoxy-1,4-benzoquinol methylase